MVEKSESSDGTWKNVKHEEKNKSSTVSPMIWGIIQMYKACKREYFIDPYSCSYPLQSVVVALVVTTLELSTAWFQY